jgi:hypothetical protein
MIIPLNVKYKDRFLKAYKRGKERGDYGQSEDYEGINMKFWGQHTCSHGRTPFLLPFSQLSQQQTCPSQAFTLS